MTRSNPGSAGLRARTYYQFGLLAGLLLLVAAPVVWWFARPPVHAIQRDHGAWVADPGQYAGADACRSCHAGIVEKQLASNHAHTVRPLATEAPLAPFETNQVVRDPLTGARYTMERSPAGKPAIVVRIGDQSASEELAYEFGSGVHAFGYLANLGGGSWVDARLNYYSAIHGWDFTSSQDKPNAYLTQQPLGRPQTESKAAECFGCHGTVVRVEGTGAEPDGAKVRLRPDRSALQVSCEACHGPRAAHVAERSGGKVPPAQARISADEMNGMCGKCHGLTGVNPAHPVIARFQPWGLSRSRCFRASAGRLTCSTCHDPHTNAERALPYYDAKCLGCHSSGAPVAKTVCPVNRTAGCVKCHMPEDSRSMLHITFRDHRIRIPDGDHRSAQP